MSKELEALERIRKNLTHYKDSDDSPYLFEQDEIDLDIIETALERLVELEDIFSEIESGEAVVVSVEKNKALEIIKEKFEIGVLQETCNNDLKVYQLCSSTARKYITQEEYELLKEVLL